MTRAAAIARVTFRWFRRGVIVGWIVLIVAVAAAWVRSKHYSDEIMRSVDWSDRKSSGSRRTSLESNDGTLRVWNYESTRSSAIARTRRWITGAVKNVSWEHDSRPVQEHIFYGYESLPERLGFSLEWGGNYKTASVPYWAIGAPLLVPLVTAPFIYRRRRRRARQIGGLCIACGYDLRASSDRCPECGKIIETSRAEQKVG